MACLCAPTSHEGSFRCRLHRACAPNPISNPALSSANHPIKALTYCSRSSDDYTSNQIGCIFNVHESSASTAPHPSINDRVCFSHSTQAAADRHSTRIRSSLPSDTFASSSSSSSSSPPKSSAFRLTTLSSSSSFSYSVHTSSPSSSLRAPASSSSPSPSSPFSCTRPPPAKRLSSPSSLPSKSSFHISSPLVPPSSWCGGATSNITPSASHAAAMAIMKQHSHNKAHSSRTHNRNPLSPMSASKIGPSRLSRMAVACADELPIIKPEQCISSLHQDGSAPDTFSSSLADISMQGGLAPVKTAQIKAPQIGLKMRATVNRIKQSESSSCRIVGSKKGSLIMPTVY